MVSIGRNQACPECGSETVVFSANADVAQCPGICSDAGTRNEVGPECCVGDEAVKMVCNDCGTSW